MSISNRSVDLTKSTADLMTDRADYIGCLSDGDDAFVEWCESGIEIIDGELARRAVLGYIKVNWFQGEHTIARALDLNVIIVGDILVELERTDADVVVRDGIIGYTGHTDRSEPWEA